MRKETLQNKLADLLGLTELKVEVDKRGRAVPKKKGTSYQGITEDEIQEFRAAQGVVYFLQAPELFTPKTCPHCGEGFLVSRQHVKFCSYTCIEKDLEQQGLKFTRKGDIESLVRVVYDGNEPIWIRNLDTLRAILNSEELPREKHGSLTAALSHSQ